MRGENVAVESRQIDVVRGFSRQRLVVERQAGLDEGIARPRDR